MFCPLGFLLPALDRKYSSLKRTIAISFLFSLCIETLQLLIMVVTPTSWRVFDVDDIIANTLGGITGLFFYNRLLSLFLINCVGKGRHK
ncbi:VanZ family protein [Syntrophobotulus glycolicus]|uniref:VanZ family protein n=1 Tax=Syntrophobotulus glycolicus TaxID=51197 RepID=UPI003D019939